MKTKNLTIIISMFWLVNIIQAQEPFICQGQYFLSLSTNIGSNSGLFLVEVDDVSGNTIFNPIATSVGLNMNAIGYRKTDNFIYGVNPNPSFLRLSRVGSDGVGVDLGVPQGINLSGNYYYYAGDVTPDGNFLILLGQSFGSDNGLLAFVDLNDPNYQVTNLDLESSYGGIYDIAFDPFSGDLYGFSTTDARLVKINTITGVVESTFPQQAQVNQVGALFFDVSGNLFGYGTINGQNTLVGINIETGEMSAIANGPPSSGEDGCSCPYSVDLKKIVSTDIALPCTEVVYTFVITNSSGLIHTGLQLSDLMPSDFSILEVLSNPYGGTEFIDGSILDISGMNVPPGIDSIRVLVEIGADALGMYQNQAVLLGLPPSLGDFTVSDNPETFEARDSTPILIEPLEITFIEEEYMLCPGETIPIDVSLYGVVYLWEDGSNSSTRLIDTAGEYSVTITSGCDQVIAGFEVITELDYTFLNERYYICENQLLEINVSDYGTQYLWDNGSENPIRSFTEAGDYSVTITDACDITVIDYEMLVNGFYLNILEEEMVVELGEPTSLNAIYWADGVNVSFEWLEPLSNSLDCIDCLSTIARPLFDAVYTLIMTIENGCTYQDQVLVRVEKKIDPFTFPMSLVQMVMVSMTIFMFKVSATM